MAKLNLSPEEISREREKCLNEMKAVRTMAENWKKNYLTSAVYPGHDAHFPADEFMNPGGDWGFLVKELWTECDEYIYPYVSRFKTCGYISAGEFRAFMNELQEAIYNFGAELIELYWEWWFATELSDDEKELYLTENGKFPDEELKKIWSVLGPRVLNISLAGGIL